MIKQKNRRKPS